AAKPPLPGEHEHNRADSFPLTHWPFIPKPFSIPPFDPSKTIPVLELNMKKTGSLASLQSVDRTEKYASIRPQQPTEWLTAKEAAEHLRVKARTLLLWTRQGKINGYALSGSRRRVWRYLRAELDATVLGRPVLCSISPSVLVAKGERQ